jgi:hypothetical protein
VNADVDEQTIPRVKGGPVKEWIRAIKGGPTPGANFDYSAPLTEMVLLGNLAVRTGKKIIWNSESSRCTNVSEANAFLSRKYREF